LTAICDLQHGSASAGIAFLISRKNRDAFVGLPEFRMDQQKSLQKPVFLVPIILLSHQMAVRCAAALEGKESPPQEGGCGWLQGVLKTVVLLSVLEALKSLQGGPVCFMMPGNKVGGRRNKRPACWGKRCQNASPRFLTPSSEVHLLFSPVGSSTGVLHSDSGSSATFGKKRK
jgi:hypothetical protein